jgi:hypothetical protein
MLIRHETREVEMVWRGNTYSILYRTEGEHEGLWPIRIVACCAGQHWDVTDSYYAQLCESFVAAVGDAMERDWAEETDRRRDESDDAAIEETCCTTSRDEVE